MGVKFGFFIFFYKSLDNIDLGRDSGAH